MDKLSLLISQARPLYKTRKRRKTIAKMLVCITLPVLIFGNFMSLCYEGDKVYMSLENDNIQNEILYDDYDMLELQ